jgi:hypothetical protein
MNTTVEKIHTAFDQAQEWLLQEAEKYEEKKTVSEKEKEYVESMKKLGFVNAEKVKEISEREEELAKSKKLTELVLYYKRTYPLLKFVTVRQLEDICEKYNLIYAPVENYKGSVPEKNLREIMNAQVLKDDDKPHNQVVRSRGRGRVRTETTVKEGLFIAAPESEFDLSNLTKDKTGLKGYFKQIIEEKPDDPIVFRYVFGGIQVLSKWGPEAEDPELINPIDN